MAIYALSLSALLGTSALYHRVNWKRPEVRRWMRRLDHSMIFFLIAGTYTPFALLVLSGPLADAILVVVWIGAIAGAMVEMVWIDHPKWVAALIYMSLGWVACVAFPELWSDMGVAGTLLVAAGGLLYTAGAVVYATQRPNPNPRVFGYHEVFHALVIPPPQPTSQLSPSSRSLPLDTRGVRGFPLGELVSTPLTVDLEGGSSGGFHQGNPVTPTPTPPPRAPWPPRSAPAPAPLRRPSAARPGRGRR